MKTATVTKQIARIEYTVERRGVATRKAVEVASDKVEKTIAKLVETKDAYNFVTSFELPR